MLKTPLIMLRNYLFRRQSSSYRSRIQRWAAPTGTETMVRPRIPGNGFGCVFERASNEEINLEGTSSECCEDN